ncbi:SDR family NAD(P)-dependent oxidoreductase [Spiribacter aquaticus]|uniref:SDR family NAD(P)-dependent oxidoreductase n=1 Tax=Spiribacter aquaticus TaxID=1935996 RepID=A0A557RJS8_9GAMM|nr:MULTISPECIES: SDR family NAD(P)-dependent oxidoreductase [Spiribacter]KAF0280067.1 short-chain dehydrogenase [Spiribacter roseus]TVO65405.1 SDR family NAD(P)-dependent oxidoreductase [Spiribacter aquaticus]
MNQPLPAPADATLDPTRLSGQRILITGAAGALGSALAEQLAAQGADTVLLDKSLNGLEALHDRIEAAGHGQPALYPLDLMGAGPDDYAELADRLAESLGGVDAVVHAAADFGSPAPLSLYDPQAWLKCLHVNINAAFLLTQALLGLLRDSQGRVIFISDAAGRSGQAAMGAYGVSKWAVEGLAATLAAEYSAAHPVISCSVDPGAIQSTLRRQLFTGETVDEVPTAEIAARAVATLVDPAATPANGAMYRVSR